MKLTRLCARCGAPYTVRRHRTNRRNNADHQINCAPCRAALVPWLRYGLATRAVEEATWREHYGKEQGRKLRWPISRSAAQPSPSSG